MSGANWLDGGGVVKDPVRRSTGEVHDIFDPPLTPSPRKQTNKTFCEDSASQISQDVGSLPSRCDHCGTIGHFANHLRQSQQCIQAYKSYQEFDLQCDNDEEFVVKVCLLSKNCPSPTCPGGSHKKMPAQCLEWWIEYGWKNMKWKGVNADSTSKNIHEKMRQHRRIHLRRTTKGESQHSDRLRYQDKNTYATNSVRCSNQLGDHGLKADCSECVKCGQYRGPLAAHLFQSKACLQSMRRDYLGGVSGHSSPRKMIMDLSLLLLFCPNPECMSTTLGEGPIQHLQGSCGQYIVSEAVAVYNWDKACDTIRIEGKLRRRASYLNEVSRQAQFTGPNGYQQELSNLLEITCSMCFMQGHVSALKEHNMVECVGSDPPMWQCQRCFENQGERQDILRRMFEEQRRLGETRHNDLMRAVRIQDGEDSRIVFMPPSLAPELPVEDIQTHLDPKKTTVLVPDNPDALDLFDEETMDDALKENRNLKSTTEFFAKRIFFSPTLSQTLTVMLRKKLAEIKENRLRMLGGMKSTQKGTVVSRNPNQAKIRERKPHYDVTKSSCLTSSCPWSVGHLQQRGDESAAISCANGQLKTRVRLGVLSSLAQGSPELAKVMMLVAKFHYSGRIFPLISTAPIVLQFAKAKIDLMVKHVISKKYSNWDLNVNFLKDEWSVELMGTLYSAEYNVINEKIARQGASMQEVVHAVLRQPEVRPIVSLDKQWIADHCGIRVDEAQDIAVLAKRYQADGPPEPLSMVLLLRGEGVFVSAQEKVHRQRLIELSQQYGPDVVCEDAIVEIMTTLTVEGLYIDVKNIDEEIKQAIQEQIPDADRSDVRKRLIILYHAFICQTNTKKWTLPRNPGECRVEAYIPRILQVTKMKMTAETEVYGDGVQPQNTDLESDVSKHITDSDNWKEISLLEYVNGHLPEDDRLVGPRSQRLVQVVTSKGEKVSWRKAKDHDIQREEDIFVNQEAEENEYKGYVRSKGDVRRLYEARPEKMSGMRLGQFAAEYREIQAGGNGLESAKSKIDAETDVGPDSDGRVIGMENLAAPQCMKLSNGVVMQRRTGQPAVLHLLHSGAPGRFGHKLLWEPWQYLEDVTGNQVDEETVNQKNTRLAIFPMSVYPTNLSDEES